MLIRFAVENFLSFHARQELTLVASSLKDSREALVPLKEGGIELLRSAVVYGANASGKTNVLKALSFVSWAVENSHVQWKPESGVPRRAFLLAPECKNEPSVFLIDFVLDGTRHEYEFAVDEQRVVHERLFSFPRARRQLWFERQGSHFRFGKALAGENRAIQALTRENSLFLSAAAQNNHKQLSPVYAWFKNRITFVNKHNLPSRMAASVEMAQDDQYKTKLVELLRAADLGICGMEVNEERAPPEAKRLMEVITSTISKELGRDGPDLQLPDVIREAALLHAGPSGLRVPMPLDQESDGTACLLALGGNIIRRLSDGGVLCVDELDLSLHPVIALQVVKMFMDPRRNPGNAQLIFNTHNTTLLSERVLRRDQIWFTEKDNEGATTLYPLTDFKPRRNESLEVGYLQGRYGAIPFVNEPITWGPDGAEA